MLRMIPIIRSCLNKQKGVPMATIQQTQLFVWSDIENLGDLERLNLLLNNIPDESLVLELERQRNKGIDEMFNTLIEELKVMLPELGKYLSFDGKAIESLELVRLSTRWH